MKIETDKFRVREGHSVKLGDWSTRIKLLYKTKDDYRDILADQIERLSASQGLLYADERFAVLLILQAMDAAGKDGVIKHVMSGVNPQGCQVFSFKQPSATELRHDFLWRAVNCLPERGRIGIFNRSYYEETLIVRVHPSILRSEGLSHEIEDGDSVWKERYASMVDFEKHLHRNDTRVVKIFLHLSKEEQRNRFVSRIDEPEKNWKFNASDVEERQYWKKYMKAYEKTLSATSSHEAPWYIVPADDKENARLIVSQILLDVFDGLKLKPPLIDSERRQELLKFRDLLIKEKKEEEAD